MGKQGAAYKISLLAQNKVNKKKPAKTSDAILLAVMSNPHAMRAAPMKAEPVYPAGRVR
jgi:hypothetical protein